MKVALYLRVSTEDQTVENQRFYLDEFCKNHNWEVVETFQEEETAWRAGHQAELARLLSLCRHQRKKPDIVVVWALDRLTRQGSGAILSLVNTFKSYDVKVISIEEPWTEVPGEMGDLLYAIAGWVAQQESKRRSERTKAGLDRLRRAGKKLGRPKGSLDKKQRKKRTVRRHVQNNEPNLFYRDWNLLP